MATAGPSSHSLLSLLPSGALAMGKNRASSALMFFAILLLVFSLASAAPHAPARIVGGFVSNALSALMKWMWSMKSSAKTSAISGRSMMKFESGYSVETVFDGSKLGIEPYSVEIAPSGDLLVLDSVNSNVYRISQPLSRYSRPRLVAGSPEGNAGHVDGKLREAKMNNPKGIAVDDRGNIYVADTMNMAIRKISDAGVTTIAGGSSSSAKWGKGGHVDGPSEDAKFSNDFDVVYVGSSCSLLVIDRGNQAIREIQLNFDDCAYQYGSGFPLGTAVLLAAGFFGYMLALLQRRVGGMVTAEASDRGASGKATAVPPGPYQKPFMTSVRPPLIPSDGDPERPEDEGIFASLGKLISGTAAAVGELLAIVPFPGRSRRSARRQQDPWRRHAWPAQESFVIRDEDEPPPPPPAETRTPTPRKTYAFMSKDSEKLQQLKQGRAYFGSWEGERKQQVLQQRLYSAQPQTVFQRSCDATNEVVFGAVPQGSDNQPPPRYRVPNYMAHSHGS
ncbi:NHL domain-containing protein [Wolffia australiana]